MNNKAIIEFGFRRIFMKNSADLGGCYPPRPSASVDNTLLDLQENCGYKHNETTHMHVVKTFIYGLDVSYVPTYIFRSNGYLNYN